MKKRWLVTAAVALSLTFAFTGCKKDETPVEEPKKVEKPAKKVDTHEGEAKSLLTGEWIDEELVTKRPVAIMISNIKEALPQYGTSKADIFYECPVEGGLTRMMAIYRDYSGLDKIGSVRSCRLYFPQFANEFNAIYVHFGQASYAESYLNSSVDNINGLVLESQCFTRDNTRKKPHNAFIDTEGINKGIEKMKYDTTLSSSYANGHYQFAEDKAPVNLEGEDAVVVKPGYAVNKPWFVYDSESGLYKRYEYGESQIDKATDTQLEVKNILIQCCKWNYEPDNKYLRIDTVSGGEGYYITNGKVIPVTWKKDRDGSPAHYYDASGNEITLNQGKTWVCVVQNTYADKITFYSSEEEYKAAQ